MYNLIVSNSFTVKFVYVHYIVNSALLVCAQTSPFLFVSYEKGAYTDRNCFNFVFQTAWNDMLMDHLLASLS